MVSEYIPTVIERISKNKGVSYRISSRDDDYLSAAWETFKRVGFVSLILNGHEEKLFKEHLSFKTAAKSFAPPSTSQSQPLHAFAAIAVQKLQSRFRRYLNYMLEGIFRLPFTEDTHAAEDSTDKPYLQGVLMTFLQYPAIAFNEVDLEYHTKKRVVGGATM